MLPAVDQEAHEEERGGGGLLGVHSVVVWLWRASKTSHAYSRREPNNLQKIYHTLE